MTLLHTAYNMFMRPGGGGLCEGVGLGVMG